MKRYLIATAVGAMVFAGALGSAAALNVNGNPVAQYGEDMNLVCDASGVTVDGLAGETDGVSQSTHIKVSDVASACEGKYLVVTAVGAGGGQIGKAVQQVPSGGGTMNLAWSNGGFPVQNVEGLRFTIG